MDSPLIPNPEFVLPDVSQLRRSEQQIHRSVPNVGLGLDAVKEHLTKDVAPAASGDSSESRVLDYSCEPHD